MEKFNTMLNKLGLRGLSDDDLRRSAQSTPRLSRRHHITEPTRDGQRSYGSVSSVENYRIRLNQDWTRELELCQQQQQQQEKKASRRRKSRSCDVDRPYRVGLGLDRAWEAERARGLELLYQSMERQRTKNTSSRTNLTATQQQHQLQQQHQQHQQHNNNGPTTRSRNKKKKKDRDKKSSHSRSRSASRDKNEVFLVDTSGFHAEDVMVDPNFRISQERLERRIEELNKQLLAEKHSSRRDKLMLARLQQEMARQKSERQLRETLMRELERERMLRITAEQQLREITRENDMGQTNLKLVQDEYKRMEEIVKSLMMYKGKVDVMKQEKTSMAISYENNTQKYRTHISNLEQENRLLMVEMKNLESQCANCHLCNTDAPYRMSKTGTPLTPAADDSHKTKVLLERLKMLEAEKSSLVLENETQQQQYDKCLDEIANQVVQALMSQKALREECSKLQKRVQDLEAQNRQLNQMFMKKFKLSSDSVLQAMFFNGRVPHSMGQSSADGSQSFGKFSELSLDSLQSICSDYNEQLLPDESLGKAALSSPPPWLRDLVQSGDSPTSSIFSPPSMIGSSNGSDSTKPSGHAVVMATSTSSSSDQSASRPDSTDAAQIDPNIPKLVKISNEYQKPLLSQGIKIETEFPAEKASPKVKHLSVGDSGQTVSNNQDSSTSMVNKRDDILQALTAMTNKIQGLNNNVTQMGNSTQSKDGLMEGSQNPQENILDDVIRIQNNLFDDSDSDTSSSFQPHFRDSSAASTVSLNDILDRGLEDFGSPHDDPFGFDDIQLYRVNDQANAEDVDESAELKRMILAGREVLHSESTNSNSSLCDQPLSNQTPSEKSNKESLKSTMNNHWSVSRDHKTKGKLPMAFVRPNSLELNSRKTPNGRPGYCSDDESSGSDSGLDKKCLSESQENDCKDNQTKPNKKSSRAPAKAGRASNLETSTHHLQVPSVVVGPRLDSGDYVLLTIPREAECGESVDNPDKQSNSKSAGVTKAHPSQTRSGKYPLKSLVSSPESAVQSLLSFSSESDTISGDQGFEEKSDTSLSGATTETGSSPYHNPASKETEQIFASPDSGYPSCGKDNTSHISVSSLSASLGACSSKSTPHKVQNPSNHAGDYVYLDPLSPFVKPKTHGSRKSIDDSFANKYILHPNSSTANKCEKVKKKVDKLLSRSNSLPDLEHSSLNSNKIKKCHSDGDLVETQQGWLKDCAKKIPSSKTSLKEKRKSGSKQKKRGGVSSKDAHQCIVGYVLIDQPVPKLDYLIPRM